MKIARSGSALMLAGVLSAGAAPLAACQQQPAPMTNPVPPTSNDGADCEQDEQGKQYELRDPDCGYYDPSGNWVWFAWVVLGLDSKPQADQKGTTKTHTRPATKPSSGSSASTTRAEGNPTAKPAKGSKIKTK